MVFLIPRDASAVDYIPRLAHRSVLHNRAS